MVRDFFGLPSDWSFRRFRVVPSPLRTAKHFGVSHVEELVQRLALASGQPGDPAEEPRVEVAAGAPAGHEKGSTRSVTLAPSADAGAWAEEFVAKECL